ncbi:hypothetical protein FVE85_0032 [Porphyridium purpureum]|uniref:CCHC-type domain-containing protein n=1 Tax=Porphyridium purpureum TaxID=35688 RepID=A0A5J4Z0F3_PORPP|nr:hypothetical protein FVE85_0032 [Porphyridium purpureum]|eukprot:POR6711..scf208_2
MAPKGQPTAAARGGAGARGGAAARHRILTSTRTGKQQTGGVAKLPTLRYLPRGELPAVEVVTWFKALETHSQREYGEVARLFYLGEGGMTYPVYEDISVIGQDEAVIVDPSSVESFVARERVKHQIAHYYKKTNELEEHKRQVFGLIRGQLSLESEAAIVRVAGMEAVMVDGNDPKKLLEAILSTHLTKGAKSLVENQSHARKQYDSLAVGVGEGLTAFKGRFYAAIRAMIVVGEAPPDQARQTVDFLGKLQMSTQYREPVVWLKNSQTDMNTVEEAVFEVGEYVSPMWQNRPRPGTTFAAGGARESDSDTEDAKAAKPDRAFKGKCYGCGQFGHMFANCDVAAPAAGRRAHPEEETIALLKEQVASLMAERDAPVRAHRKYKKKTGAALLGGLSVLDDESTSENDE